jgi:hypothetical protein
MNINVNDLLIDTRTNQKFKILNNFSSINNTYTVLSLTDGILYQKGGIYILGELVITHCYIDLNEKLYRLIENI